MTRATRLARRKPRRRASAGDASFDSGPDRDGRQPIIAARPPEILRLHAFLEHPPGYHFPCVVSHGRRDPLAEVRSGRPRVAVAPKHISHQLCPVPSDRDGLQGPPRRLPMANFRIENVVASTSLGRELDLKAIALALGGSEYEPEQFPGLIYRIDEPKVVLLMFGSGKVVCTGARKPADVEKAVEKITAELKANGLLH